jgi:hypothetical protein
MVEKNGPHALQQIVQLTLRGQRSHTLVNTPADWQALGDAATRTLFWCGGAIYGCRCEGNQIQFAIQLGNASIGDVAHHLTAVYATHLRRDRKWRGSIFKHYQYNPLVDEIYLDDFVFWLHRTSAPDSPASQSPSTKSNPTQPVWTGDAAYLTPSALSWIDTAPVFRALSSGATPSAALYRKRKAQPISAPIIAAMTRRTSNRKHTNAEEPLPAQRHRARRPTLDTIVRVVATHCGVGMGDMRSPSRKRDASKAKLIATVLYTRNGGTVAAAARLFRRSRSTLIERAEHYRKAQPELFSDAEAALNTYFNENR